MCDAVSQKHFEMGDETVAELEKINVNLTSTKEKELCENNDEYVNQNQRSPFRRQALISFGVFMMTLGAGSTSGISAILIPQLQQGTQKFSIELVSWVAAISSLALFFGNLMSGYLMDRFGRRLSSLLLSATFVTGWLIIGFSNNVMQLILLGRFITGLCQGWLGPLGPVYVGEISAPVHRGLFLAALSLGIAVGVFMSHLFGTLFHWSLASLLCGFFPLIGGIILYYAPESPAWLASRNRIDECVISYQWYRGKSQEMKTELDKMLADIASKNRNLSKMQILSANIKKPEFLKPLGIMTVFFVITQLCGVNVICAYTTDMVEELLGSGSNSSYTYAAMLSIDVLRCVSLGAACLLLRRSGRRPLAVFSGVFTSLSLIALALYLYLFNTGVIKYLSPFISLGLMGFYIIVSNLGISPLPWNMVGELFAVETKGLCSGISVMMTSIAFFAVVKSAPAMFLSIGHHGTYLFYGISTFCGTVFLYFCLPETKDKTLLQIEEHFRYGKKKESKKDAANI
ncbi:solute carrier family 2, facilitated glucose transporter member 8-like isoform X1 [Trichoplusia ni]|uniref:Solute carrier family 2, facilitated glucose transporter member 8-like isoform X1 n=1 Tax=Trichoplusia ni TaxID=7111 RepID=A0A7E5X4K0_TRINI|nr:solute carrier family 2, facilitated glucose transporter member 8-like isoform X1 [Trichoplusia ni]